jgi:hypothetical protein
LVGIPHAHDQRPMFYVIPAIRMMNNVVEGHKKWLDTPGRDGNKHDPKNPIRSVRLPPHRNINGWNISRYADRWDLIERKIHRSSALSPSLG